LFVAVVRNTRLRSDKVADTPSLDSHPALQRGVKRREYRFRARFQPCEAHVAASWKPLKRLSDYEWQSNWTDMTEHYPKRAGSTSSRSRGVRAP